jgi:hypothetical protein
MVQTNGYVLQHQYTASIISQDCSERVWRFLELIALGPIMNLVVGPEIGLEITIFLSIIICIKILCWEEIIAIQ